MSLGSDLRCALRAMRRNPGFSAVAIATLAFGIGANTAIFSVVYGVLIRPLGYGDESRLVAIHEVMPRFSHLAPRIPVNAMHFHEWRKRVSAFESLALIGGIRMNLTGAGEPERLAVARVSPDLFPLLGARTQLGRTFLEEEDQPGRDDVVVLSNAFWKRRFASDPSVLGRKVLLDGHPYEIVGVLSPLFHFPKLSHLYAMTIAEEQPDLWKPFAAKPDELEALGDFNFACIARLRSSVSLSQALSELNAAQAVIASQAPEKIELFAAIVPLQEQITGRSRRGLQLLLCAAGAVLLIGCVNIANLLLGRTTSRKQELAIRSALGASFRRLVQQMLAESLLLAGIGGALGVSVAYVSLRLILAHAPIDLPRLDEIRLDTRVLLFTTAVSCLSGLLCGFLPAWRFAGTRPIAVVKSGIRSTEGRAAGRLRALLIGVEVGLSTLCLVAGGLLLHSFVNLFEVDKGFAAEQVLTVNLSLPDTRYPDQPDHVRFMRSLVDSVEALPGVVSAGISNMLPLSGEGGNNLVSLEGTTVPLTERPLVDIRGVNPEYFQTMNIPLREGRIFAYSDGERRLAIVSALTAERLWPGQNPLGKRFKVGDPDGPFIEVSGVVGDVRTVSLDRPPSMTVYLPYWQRRTFGGPSLAVKTAVDPLSMSSSIRSVIHRIDSELPVPRFETMDQVVDESVAQRRFQMNLILLFAAMALVLASLGIYGVVSYSVVLRTNEIGIRMAVGACGRDILKMILRQAMTPVAVGVGAGLVASIVVGRLLASLLFGVAPADISTMASVVMILAGVAASAGFVPARRASRVEPMIALRYE
ncbi:MAG TPA: ABC transporter permease [Terriglobales bacterium]|nr:ABC transporter permease [Terriglobales bacterium]